MNEEHLEDYPVTINAGVPSLRYLGRVDKTDPEAPVFDWPGSGLSFCFRGSSAVLLFEDSGENDFSVFVDGKRKKRIVSGKGINRVVLADSLNTDRHRIDFIKSTESYQGITCIKGILLPQGSELLPLPEIKFRIQVFGDSISAGYGTAAPGLDTGWHREHADATRAWPFFLGQELDADITVTAASGRGVMRNWAEPGPRSAEPLPSLAWRILGSDPASLMPSGGPVPELIILCLGHNDLSPGYALSEKEFLTAYEEFIGDIRRRWPVTPLLCGSMDDATLKTLKVWLRNFCNEQKRKNAQPIGWYSFSAKKDNELGCDSHPNETAQKRFARDILKTIRALNIRCSGP